MELSLSHLVAIYERLQDPFNHHLRSDVTSKTWMTSNRDNIGHWTELWLSCARACDEKAFCENKFLRKCILHNDLFTQHPCNNDDGIYSVLVKASTSTPKHVMICTSYCVTIRRTVLTCPTIHPCTRCSRTLKRGICHMYPRS